LDKKKNISKNNVKFLGRCLKALWLDHYYRLLCF